MTAPISGSDRELVLTRLIAAPRRNLYRAWTEPELLKQVAKRANPGEIWDWMVVRTKEATRLVMTQDVDWISAAGIYVTLHAGGEEFLYRASLAVVADRLDPFQFVRVHRSSIVNLKSIALLERRSHGDF